VHRPVSISENDLAHTFLIVLISFDSQAQEAQDHRECSENRQSRDQGLAPAIEKIRENGK
jgi:hypothetical protein